MSDPSFRIDKNTVLLVLGILGGGGSATKVVSDIADIRERVVRIETTLDLAKRTAQAPRTDSSLQSLACAPTPSGSSTDD
jgi:hypothetical protein